MKVIYENKVKAAGIAVEEFKDAGMFIIFGENAPEEIRDYCYSVSVNPINGELAAGQYLVIDGQEYKITCVGYEAPITLKGASATAHLTSAAPQRRSCPAPSTARQSLCLRSGSVL